jgi:neurocalcin delta
MTEGEPDKVGEAPTIRTQDIFCKMDSNKDGVLSKEEFMQGCLNDETLYRLLACSHDDQES